jgi:hypothetical protein
MCPQTLHHAPLRIAATALAASQGTSSCPRPALFFSLTLLGIKTKPDFTAPIKLGYKQALMRIAPGASVHGGAAHETQARACCCGCGRSWRCPPARSDPSLLAYLQTQAPRSYL